VSDTFEKQLNNEKFLRDLFDDLDRLDASVVGGSDIAGAAAGAGVGAAASLAALYSLGVTGLSAAGITSGLAAAGALIGGGMVAGIGVLSAPIAMLAVGGYAMLHTRRQSRIKQLQREVLAKAIQKQGAILRRLEEDAHLTAEEVQELRDRNAVLTEIIRRLRK
jgi:hypothetical protein